MPTRAATYLLLALFLAACGKDSPIMAPLPSTAAPQVTMVDGRNVTGLTVNGSAPPATLAVAPNQPLLVSVAGFTTFAQVNPQWLSTSVTFTPTATGSAATFCDETNVWTSTVMVGNNLTVTFTAPAPATPGTYLVTVRAHLENFCTAVNPSAPFPSGPDQLTLIVSSTPSAPVLAPVGTQSVDELTTLTFQASATDADTPAQSLAFSLGNPSVGAFPSGAKITAGGAFSWTPAEDQGPGTYRAKIIVSDGTLTDEEEIELTVSEVNAAPALALPPPVVSQWGVTLPNVTVTASDSDVPANTLSFALVSGPTWVTVDPTGAITFGSVDASDVGTHAVRIRVTDDGFPSLSDEAEFTLTVLNRPTALTYQGRTSGQYSDKSILSATLADAGVGSLNGKLIANATIDFSIAGTGAGTATTDATGLASGAFAINQAAGSHTLLASFVGGAGYAGSSVQGAFSVSREEGSLSATFPESSPLGSDITVTVQVRELLLNGVEPVPNDGALAGDISNVAAVGATMRGVTSGAEFHATCGGGTGGSASYASTRTFTCMFAGAQLVNDVYTLQVFLPTSDRFFQAQDFEANLSIWDPQGGSATGGGSFELHGDRVTFAFNTRPQQNNSGPRSHLVVVRHLADGGVCRLKSSDQMNPGIVANDRVTLSGKGEYSCVDATGRVTISRTDVNLWLIAEDNGTPGAGVDRIWVSNSAPVGNNMLDMPHPVHDNSAVLTGGNVTVQTTQAMRKR